MNEKKKYIHFLVPELLLKEFDKAILGKYEKRAEAIREAMRLLIKEI
jgi:metal-responsive CopG/Arc/MetJ family transcriptional regulator